MTPETTEPGKQKQLDRAYERIESIVKHAKEKKIRTTLEAEDHNWTDFHLDTYVSLINAGYTNCGTVIQSRLHRTKNDLKRFDERMRVRMVIGIYTEPAAIALTQKSDMKAAAIKYSTELLSRGTYVELASHDTDAMKNFIEDAVLPTRAPATQFEIQHLLGVPRKEIQEAFASGQFFIGMSESATGNRRDQLAELARSGVLMRMYLPFGQDNVAGPYCKRRLKANPNMIGYGIKNLFHIK
jgi:proline dehydrogenase